LPPKDGSFLTQLQCRILTAIFFSKMEYLNSETILKEAGIAQSTWSEEQNRLTQMGLLEKKQSRLMTSNVITRVMNYRLTDKGRLVALNLSNISRILAPEQFSGMELKGLNDASSSAIQNMAVEERAINEKILECIEIGLDSFGMNLDELVKLEFEKAGELKWEDSPRFPEKLEALLVQLFGAGGSSTIESMIASNIRSKFGLRSVKSDKIVVLISELRFSQQRMIATVPEELESPIV
jgi:DNA-binding MarR family transcriptional regulator